MLRLPLGGMLRGSFAQHGNACLRHHLADGSCHCRYEILTRTADGNEGGRHQLLTAAVGGGNLYVCKVQIGDKRWFKGESVLCFVARL